MGTFCRGIRGATIVEADTADAILSGTSELLEQIVTENGLQLEDVASAVFSLSPDLNAAYPAAAARALGWTDTALFCCQEIPVPGAPSRCVRVLIHWNTSVAQSEVRHVYLREARSLRPDRAASRP
jgi:chorismate mutase